MNNYIKIENVSSTTIKGLYIKELPPITKPLMRYNKEEIDGRDGDLITRLGYSAYDKEITIGLAKDFDIDQVIKFFNPEPTSLNMVIPPYCTFVFSNEPERVYWGQILEQIDFNALLSFKTATVKIHIQPFKYKTGATSITGTNSLSFINEGNIYSKPIIRLTGTGTVAVNLNGTQYFTVELGDNATTIRLFTAWSEALEGWSGNLGNRKVTGDYNSFQVPVGNNTITFTGGTVTYSSIQLYSRWI